MNEFEVYVKDDFNDKDVNEFFNEIIKEFAKESLSFYEKWGEFPFIYGEKQLNSVLTPAIYKCTNNIFLEQPFKGKELNNQRFIDILTFKGRNNYLIELKHTFQSSKAEVTQKTENRWKNVLDQVLDFEKEVVSDIFETEGYTFYKVALLIIPTHMPKNKEHDILKFSSKEYIEYMNGYIQKGNKPNIIGIIKFNNFEKYAYKSKYGEKIYPFVSFIARIEKIV